MWSIDTIQETYKGLCIKGETLHPNSAMPLSISSLNFYVDEIHNFNRVLEFGILGNLAFKLQSIAIDEFDEILCQMICCGYLNSD